MKLYKNYKPFSFFTLLALVLGLVGTGFLIPVMADYFRTGLVPKRPSFIASVFFYLSAIQSFFCGLNLETLVKKSRDDFEIKCNEYADKYKELKEKQTLKI